MSGKDVLYQMLKTAHFLEVLAFLILILPAGLFGLAAYSDYQRLNCPQANQCSDALGTIRMAVVIIVGLPSLIFITSRLKNWARGSEAGNA